MYEYADDQRYPLARLDKEFAEAVDEQRSFRHSEERTAQIGRHVAHLIFGLNCRLQEELEDGR